MLKDNLHTVQKGTLNYIADGETVRTYKAWLGNGIAFLYDYTMEKNIIPKKFNASVDEHRRILTKLIREYAGSTVLELAAGSGTIAEILNPAVSYTGIDISPGLLKRASEKFRKRGFDRTSFYICSAGDLPFCDAAFDTCICSLSLNFFPDIGESIREAARVLTHGGRYIGSVPVPERNRSGSVIRGTLLSEKELYELFRSEGLYFRAVETENGALLYFIAEKE